MRHERPENDEVRGTLLRRAASDEKPVAKRVRGRQVAASRREVVRPVYLDAQYKKLFLDRRDAATQQPQKEAGALQPVLPPRDLPATPRTAFFASQKVPSNIKSGIEGSLTQMKRATSDFRQAKDTIRTAMEGLSSDILAGRGIG